ncbi:hypothetical protein [Nonomuraea sp. NPDC046570]|uniref:hypothetical protein n=1 Tax=Nonomuraea sp. NPDC046570 TaxID=3155255 RepID=UPI0033DF0310
MGRGDRAGGAGPGRRIRGRQAANDRRELATGPVAALKRALVKGYGVRFSQVEVRVTRGDRGRGLDLTTKSGGRVEFGAGDIVAARGTVPRWGSAASAYWTP